MADDKKKKKEVDLEAAVTEEATNPIDWIVENVPKAKDKLVEALGGAKEAAWEGLRDHGPKAIPAWWLLETAPKTKAKLEELITPDIAQPTGKYVKQEDDDPAKVLGAKPIEPIDRTSIPEFVGPPAKGELTSTPIDDFRSAIKMTESSNNYGAINKDPNNPSDRGALGAYQFRPGVWNKWMKERMGTTVEEMIPRKDDTPEVAKQKQLQQDKAFDIYYKEQMLPWVRQVKASGLGAGKSDVELAAIFHNRGAQDGNEYLRTGVDPQVAKGHPDVGDYVKKVNSYMSGDGNLNVAAAETPSTGGTKDFGDLGLADYFENVENIKTNLSDRQQQLVNMHKVNLEEAVKSGDQDDFAAELAKLKSDYADEKDSITKRELLYTLSDALTKIGAGYSGMKQGIDLSHLNLPQKDWEKVREGARQDFNLNLGDLKDRREDDLKRRLAASDREMKAQEAMMRQAEFETNKQAQGAQIRIAAYQALTGESRARQQQIRDQLQQEFNNKMLEFKQNKEDKDAELAANKAWQDNKNATISKVSQIIYGKEYGKDDEKGSAAIASELLRIGIPPDQAADIIREEGWLWGKDVRDPDEIVFKVGEAIDRLTPAKITTQNANMITPVTISTPQGNLTFPTQAAAEAFKTSPDYKKLMGT